MSNAIADPVMSAPKVETTQWLEEPPRQEVSEELPSWYTEIQNAAWQKFLDTPDPTRFNEEWRFADLKKLRFARLNRVESISDPSSIVERAQNDLVEEYAAHFVFANNELIHSDIKDLPEGAVCMPFNQALVEEGDLVREHFLKEERSLGGDKFAALHASATLSGLFVHFPKGCVAEHPIVAHHYVGGELAPIFPHTLIVADENSDVTVMDNFESINEDEQSLAIGMVDLIATNGAKVQYVAFQDCSDTGAKHVQINNTRVARDAKVKSAFINLGAAWVRNESVNRMVDTGADSQIFGASLATGIQEYDQRTLQCHEAQHTTSDLLFKNALYDEARTIFGGMILVKPGAHHTDSFQTCRNLLGSEKAEANATPGLEINADQVKCSHGSTSGQISDEEIFYLEARGIPAEKARQMISFGFLNEVVQRLDSKDLQDYISDKIDGKFRELLA